MSFLAKGLAGSAGFFALLGSPWVKDGFLRPLAGLQERTAAYFTGAPRVPVEVTSDCSGADVLALCLAAIFAFEAPRRARLWGAAGGAALVLALNTARIATLGHAASSPDLFWMLHLRIWPLILLIATSTYVFAWIRATRRAVVGSRPDAVEGDVFLRRLMPRLAVLLVVFASCGPWIEGSRLLFEAGAWTVTVAVFLLNVMGASATGAANVLVTTRGSFMVTPECLATALVPLYVAAVFAFPMSGLKRLLALAAAPPFFAALAICRLLLLALPPVLASSPLFLVHGFHQFVLALLVIIAVSVWRESMASREWERAGRQACIAVGSAVFLALVLGATLNESVFAVARVIAPSGVIDLGASEEAQGALTVLPAFQAAFLLGLGLVAGLRGMSLAAPFPVLFASQILLVMFAGETFHRTGLAPHPLFLRALGVGGPILLVLTMLSVRVRSAAPATLKVVADDSV